MKKVLNNPWFKFTAAVIGLKVLMIGCNAWMHAESDGVRWSIAVGVSLLTEWQKD